MLTYGSATYTYRADGLRASDGTGSSKKYYLYDGGNAICRLDSAGNLDRTYVFAPDGLVGWSIPGSTSHQMLFDWQGNLEHSTSATGNVATSHAYNAWGQRNSVFPINAVTGANDRFGYNARWGYVRDTTGLYYCQNRYYDPANGRWLNRDPIGYDGGMNLYGYCGGGPVGAADPSGLWRGIVGGILGGIGGFIVGGPPGMAAGAALFGGMGSAADELERQMASGEHIDYGRAAKAGARDAAIGLVTARIGGVVGKCVPAFLKARKIVKLTKTAQAKYPKLAGKMQQHHSDPKYMGGDPKGDTVQLDAAYHQLITNAFRKEWAYGQGAPSREVAEQIRRRVYKEFPLPDDLFNPFK